MGSFYPVTTVPIVETLALSFLKKMYKWEGWPNIEWDHQWYF
jgi:hypothetical protein